MDLIETQWVIVPVASYPEARRRAKALLASRKASRTFAPVPWSTTGPGIPKSSLDGSRECVIDESIYEDVRNGRRSADWLMKHFRARPAERLSGVDLLKRLGQELDDAGDQQGRPAFHSASHTRAGPIRTRLARAGWGRDGLKSGRHLEHLAPIRATALICSAARRQAKGTPAVSITPQRLPRLAPPPTAGLASLSPARSRPWVRRPFRCQEN